MGLERDYYWTLGVVPQATLPEIREAFRLKAMAAHPNVGGSVDQLLPIMTAWQVLSDPTARQLYDEVRAAPGNPVLREEWNRTFQQASAAADACSRAYAAAGQDFFSQLDLAAEQVQSNPAGRAAAAGVVGLVIGALVGAGAGYYMGVGPLGGAIVGMVAGAIAGAVANIKGGQKAAPDRD